MLKISVVHRKNSKFNERRAFNKAVGHGKNPKSINVGPMFILDYRVSMYLASMHVYYAGEST
jgi:hypothetical protein